MGESSKDQKQKYSKAINTHTQFSPPNLFAKTKAKRCKIVKRLRQTSKQWPKEIKLRISQKRDSKHPINGDWWDEELPKEIQKQEIFDREMQIWVDAKNPKLNLN